MMAQSTGGIRSILSRPFIYSSFQNIMGARSIRAQLLEDFIKPFAGCKILDIGCGPADILAHLPDVEYLGFDTSEAYILKATKEFGTRGKFYCHELTSTLVQDISQVDIVLALGFFHHLDDESAKVVVRLAFQALKPGGRLVAIDPCIDAGQSILSRFLVNMDRGQNIRTAAGYEAIVSEVFERPRIEVRHRAWIPYTHCYMECIRK